MKMPTIQGIQYTSPAGRDFRVISVDKIPETTKWINRTEKSHWEVLIKFYDDNTMLYLRYGYNNEYISKEGWADRNFNI